MARRAALAVFVAGWLVAGCSAVADDDRSGSEPARQAPDPADVAPGPDDGDGPWLLTAASTSASASASAERIVDRPTFAGDHRDLDAATRGRMVDVSWRPSCPVSLDDLRLLEVDHWGFDRQVRRGEMVVHVDHAGAVVEVFRELFEARFPIERMQLIDDFDGSDDASMAANNSSGFNCRTVTAGAAWSQHASGLAIDINPVQNPYVGADGEVHPPAGRSHTDRSQHVDGMIHPDGPVVRAFERAGWSWGGEWTSLKDYHHFSSTGR